MPQEELSLKEISKKVFKYIAKLSNQKVFGTIKIEIKGGRPNKATIEESFVEKDIR